MTDKINKSSQRIKLLIKLQKYISTENISFTGGIFFLTEGLFDNVRLIDKVY
jgi:hypothetical protein